MIYVTMTLEYFQMLTMTISSRSRITQDMVTQDMVLS